VKPEILALLKRLAPEGTVLLYGDDHVGRLPLRILDYSTDLLLSAPVERLSPEFLASMPRRLEILSGVAARPPVILDSLPDFGSAAWPIVDRPFVTDDRKAEIMVQVLKARRSPRALDFHFDFKLW
jgi:hypothetical protein